MFLMCNMFYNSRTPIPFWRLSQERVISYTCVLGSSDLKTYLSWGHAFTGNRDQHGFISYTWITNAVLYCPCSHHRIGSSCTSNSFPFRSSFPCLKTELWNIACCIHLAQCQRCLTHTSIYFLATICLKYELAHFV